MEGLVRDGRWLVEALQRLLCCPCNILGCDAAVLGLVRYAIDYGVCQTDSIRQGSGAMLNRLMDTYE